MNLKNVKEKHWLASFKEFLIEAKTLESKDPTISISTMLRAKEEELHKVQHLLSKNGKERREIEYREDLIREGCMADLARWYSLNTVEAKAWLQLIPTRISFRMNDAQFISALRLRLNVPLEGLTEGIVCNVCLGRQVMDSAHITNCKDKNGMNIKTHDGFIQEVG
jgi:hypothetical protein